MCQLLETNHCSKFTFLLHIFTPPLAHFQLFSNSYCIFSHLLFCDVLTFLTHSNILEGQKYCSNFFSWNTFLSGGKTILQCEKTFSLLFFPTLCMIEDFILHFCFPFSLPHFRPVIYLCVAHSQGFS